METAQALAIAAAAFVTAVVMDAPAFPSHITAHTEAAITNAWERAAARPAFQTAVMRRPTYVSAPIAAWDACDASPKRARL